MKQATKYLSRLVYSWSLKVEAMCSSKTLIEFQQATRNYIPKDINLHKPPLWELRFLVTVHMQRKWIEKLVQNGMKDTRKWKSAFISDILWFKKYGVEKNVKWAQINGNCLMRKRGEKHKQEFRSKIMCCLFIHGGFVLSFLSSVWERAMLPQTGKELCPEVDKICAK